MNTIRSSAKHEVATGLYLKSASGADLPCVSCVGGKLARHTFPDQGSDADDVLADVHIDLCGPFWMAAKDGSLYFLLQKDRKTRYVWVRPVAKNSDALQEFVQWLAGVPWEAVHRLRERQVDRPRPYLPLHPAAEQHGGVRDEDSDGVGANDVAAHGRAAPLEAPRSTAGRLGPQLPGAVDGAAGDDAILAADREEARLVAGTGMGLHGSVLGPRAAAWWKVEAEGQVGPSPRHVGGEQGLGAPRNRRKPGSHLVGRGILREHVVRGVDVGARAGVGPDADHPADGHLDGDTPSARRASRRESEVDAGRGGAGQGSAADGGEVGKGGRDKAAADRGAGSSQADQGVVGNRAVGSGAVGDRAVGRDTGYGARGCRGQQRWPPDIFVPAAFTTVYDEVDNDLLYDNAEEDEDLPDLNPDMHADPEHCWDISMMMTVKDALASWKGKAVKAAMEEEIRSLIGMGTWELVECPPRGFTQVYGADYDETYAPVSSYVTLRIFLSIVAVLDLNLMQLDMKKAFMQRKLDRVLYMYQPDYFNDGTGWVCMLLKSLYGLKQSPLLWYRALNGVLLDTGWKNSKVNMALYFKVGDDKVTCWVLVYVDNLLVASRSAAMLKELKGMLEAAFELREISLVQKYLGLEILRDRSVRKLWLHQQGYADKLRRRFLDEEQNGRTPKTPVSVDAYATLTFDDEEAQERQEEEYWQMVRSLQFAAMTTRPDIAFACSKLGSGLTVRSDQHWRKINHCLAYLTNTRDTALEFSGGAE
ncbi:unnamed protein product [Closterium sp. NIES-54]